MIETSYDGRTFHLDVPCKVAGKPVVYWTSRPEKLIIELPEGLSPKDFRTSARSGPKVHVRELGLQRTQVTVEFPYRLPPSALKVTSGGAGLALDVNLLYDLEDSYALTPGVRWRRREVGQPGDYTLWNELVVDPRDPAVRLEVGLANERLDSREKPSLMSRRMGGLAAVNGGYFGGSGGPLGVVVKDGKLLAPHVAHRPPRTVMGITKDGKISFDQVVAKAGSLASRSGTVWEDVRLALGAGPRLVHRGKLALTTDEEELGPRGNDITRKAARTAVATLRDGKVLVVTAVGFHDLHREGLRLEELAQELIRRGAQDAMNLDGGSSTSMSIGSDVVSVGGGAPRLEKEVATALVIVDSRPCRYPSRIRAKFEDSKLTADGESENKLTVQVQDGFGQSVPDGTMVRVYPERCSVKKDSFKIVGGEVVIPVATVASPGEARVRVECGSARQDAAFSLEPGPAARLSWRLSVGKVTDVEQEVALVVHASDKWANPVGNVPVACTGERNEFEESGSTGKNGNKTFLLKVPAKGTRVKLQVPGLGAQMVAIPAAAPPLSPTPLPGPTPRPSPSAAPTPAPEDD